MKNVLKIDHKNGKIIMDREFSIKSSTYGTQEYTHLQNARKDYPEYTVERKVIKKNSKKEAFKGLTYEYMEKYMNRYGVSKEIWQEYEDVRFNVQCHSVRYPKVKKWFLSTFPDIKDLGMMDEECAAADAAQVA